MLPARPKWDGRGRTTTKRLATNEEIMLQSLKTYGYLSVRVAFAVKDEDGAYRGLKGKAVVVKKMPNQGMVLQLVDSVEKCVVDFVTKKGK